MRIITLTCPDCGTIVAGNVIEKQRVMRCPSRTCQETLRFEDLDDGDREHILSNGEKYRID